MKKRILLLVLALLFSCGVEPASAVDRNLTKFISALDSVVGGKAARSQAFPYIVRHDKIKHTIIVYASPVIWNIAKPNRKSLVERMWRIWASQCQSEVKNIDHCRIKVEDTNGRDVGGSRAIAGSVIYVK